MKYTVTEDSDFLLQVMKAIAENDGYCPCAIEKNDDTKCMCKYFREEVPINEWCHCGIYQKIKE